MTPIIASTTVTFSTHSQGIQLEEDKDRVVPPTTYSSGVGFAWAATSRYLRLYHSTAVKPVVTAITGSVAEAGADIQRNVIETKTITPDQPSASVPGWAINVTVSPVGRALDAEGKNTPVTWFYDVVSKSVKCSKPVYGAVRIKYDAPYKLLLYKFTGACPIIPPATHDKNGNALEVVPPEHFATGVVYAVDYATGDNAHAVLSPPECQWPGGMKKDPPEKMLDGVKYLPTLKLEVDSEHPAAFTADGDKLGCEVIVRAMPGGITRNVYVNKGWFTPWTKKGSVYKEEVLLFALESSKTLESHPAGAVNLRVVKVMEPTWPDAANISFYGPGQTVIETKEAKPGEPPPVPVSRVVKPGEVVATGSWRHERKVVAMVIATYTTTFDTYRYQFDYDKKEKEFEEATMVAIDTQDRAATLSLKAPSMKSRSRGFAK